MTAQTLEHFLKSEQVPFRVFTHRPAYTAQEEAAAAHVPGRGWAKVVVFMADGEPLQAIVPADLIVTPARLTKLCGACAIRLATEDELALLYPDCELGGMPPFGSLVGQRVFVDYRLTREHDIVFNAGDHSRAIVMRYVDFDDLVRPIVGDIATRRA
jgi:Ala-tRNA(Pro) deacylase